MMVLGIETATDVCGLAVTENKRLMVEYRLNLKRAHGEKLVACIQHILEEVGLGPQDIELISISIGPGSFTGLRIGLSTAKGMAYAHDIPLVSIVTLDALASQAVLSNLQICPILKARGDEVYSALYQSSKGMLQRISDYKLLTLHELKTFLNRETLVLTSEIEKLHPLLNTDLKGCAILAPPEHSMLSGYTIARLGYQKFLAGQIENIELLEPFYIKQFQVTTKP